MFYQNYQRPAIGAILDQTPHHPTDRGSSISVSTGSQLVVALSKEKPTEVLVEVSVITKKLSKAFQAASSSHWKLMAREKFNKPNSFGRATQFEFFERELLLKEPRCETFFFARTLSSKRESTPCLHWSARTQTKIKEKNVNRNKFFLSF